MTYVTSQRTILILNLNNMVIRRKKAAAKRAIRKATRKVFGKPARKKVMGAKKGKAMIGKTYIKKK